MNSSSVPVAMNDDRRTASASSSPIITNAFKTTTAHDNAVTAGVVQVQAVSNPYALKKSGPQLSMKPLHEAAVTATTTPGVLDASAATAGLSANVNDAADFSLSRASSDRPHFSAEKDNIAQNHPTSPISEKEAITTTAIATVSTSGGIHLPMWQRLPSRNLSFQSAEILTVTECLQHVPLYAERSVRVTGSIFEKFVHSTVADQSNDNMNNSNNDNMNMVSLLLSDPLAALPPSRNAALRRRSTSLGGNTNRRVSFPKTPSSALHKIQQTGTGAGNTTSVTKRTPGTHTILRRKSGGLLGGGGDGAAFTPGLASSRKRRSSGAFKATNPEDVLVQTLASSSLSSTNCLWVLANPQHVSVTHSTTGDLVMAMGEIREYKPEDSDLPSSIHKIAARIRAAQQQPQQPGRQTSVTGQAEEPGKKKQQHQQYRPIYFLQTRILRNANGTNMKLHTEALYARRQQLVAARSRSRQPCSISADSAALVDQIDASASCVWPGCGPPPYDINDSKSS
jgi:hypothetical protein